MDPKGYWKQVCAPVVRGKKAKFGRSLSNTAIAASIERATGKDTSRQLVEHWFRGIREPYMSQFIAMCDRLEIDPIEVLKPASASRKWLTKTQIYNSAVDEKKKGVHRDKKVG